MGDLVKKKEKHTPFWSKIEIQREEAEELYAFDNDEIDNEEVIAIEEKEQKNKRTQEKRSSIEKVKHMKAKIKADINKQNIIDDIFAMAQTSEHIFNPQEMTSTKLSFQDKDGNFYTLQITKHKSRPEGYVADLKQE